MGRKRNSMHHAVQHHEKKAAYAYFIHPFNSMRNSVTRYLYDHEGFTFPIQPPLPHLYDAKAYKYQA
jgi:hypothetical protein